MEKEHFFNFGKDPDNKKIETKWSMSYFEFILCLNIVCLIALSVGLCVT